MATSTPEMLGTFEEFAKPLVESGRYKTSDEVLTAAMEALRREEGDDDAKAASLQQEIEAGFDSGLAAGGRVRTGSGKNRPPQPVTSVRLELRYTQRANEDLVNIAAFTRQRWDLRQADRYIAQLEECCERLVQFTGLGRSCSSLRPDLLRAECGSHVIFYEVTGPLLVIGRILHKSRIPRRLMFY